MASRQARSAPPAASEAAARTVIQPAPTAATATVIGDFEIIDKLGQGGMGAVYRARQRSLDRLVALKVLPEQFSSDPEFLARFQREARVAASLQHANLVRVFSAGQADACHYIAMELLEGENLHQRLKRERLAIPEPLRICAEVACGLEFGWDRAQLIHRDIKPANIYLSHTGEVKVGDLGIAKSLTGETTGLTQAGSMMGTPYYMSPEQIRGDKTLDFRADVYSLGCTLYEMLTGKPPYPGSDPITIARFVGRMLKKPSRERHPSYADLIAEIESVMQVLVHGDTSAGRVATAWKQLGEEPVLAMPKPATPRPATTAVPSPRSKLPLYGAIAAGVLVLGGLAIMLMRPAKPKRAAGVPLVKAASTAAETPAPLSSPRPAQAPLPAGGLPLPAITGWEDAMQRLKNLRDNTGASRGTEENGWFVAAPYLAAVLIRTQPLAGTAVRGRLRGKCGVLLRASLRGHYIVEFSEKGTGTIGHHSLETGQTTYLARFTMSQTPEHDFLITMTGPDIRVWVDGVFAAEARDTRFEKGGVSVGVLKSSWTVRDLAVAELPADFFAKPSTPTSASDEQWTDLLGPALAKRPLLSWHKQVGTGLEVSEFKSFSLDSKTYTDVAVRATAAHQRDGVVLKLPIITATGSAVAVHGCHCVHHSPARKIEEALSRFYTHAETHWLTAADIPAGGHRGHRGQCPRRARVRVNTAVALPETETWEKRRSDGAGDWALTPVVRVPK